MRPLDERLAPQRRPMRFVAFGIAVLIGVTVLTGRLAYMQLVNGEQYLQHTDATNVVQAAVPSTRGLIYDRAGRPLVTNVPSWVVKVRPADLVVSKRDSVVTRLAGLLNMSATDINTAIDSNPGSRFDLVRIANDVPEPTARLISEESADLPGVQVVVESHRQYLTGPLFAQILGYTGPVSADQLKTLAKQGYLPDDWLGKAGVEASYESYLRGTYGIENVQRDASGKEIAVLNTVKAPQAGSSLQLTIDTKEQKLAQQALQWGIDTAHLESGVLIVMNPQTGEVLAMVSLPTYDDNDFAGGISAKDYAALLADKNKPLTNHAIAAHYPPGSTYKLVAGTGVLADGKITPQTRIHTAAYLTLGGFRFRDWNGAGFGECNIYCGFGHSSDTFFYQAAAMLGIDRLGYWAHQYGFGRQTGIDLPSEASGIVPTNQWKVDEYGLPIYPGEVYLAGIGQGYDAVTPLQLLNAYATLANGGTRYAPHVVKEVIGPDGTVTEVEPQVVLDHKAPASTLRVMRHAARNVPVIHHTYNLVDLPIVVAGKTGTAEFGSPGPNGDYPFHNWFVSFTPKDPWKKPGDPYGFKAIEKGDSELAVVVFSYNAGTLGNTSTEISKYFYQLHYGINRDYRLPYLMDRGPYYRAPD
jgi:penicillin-binding protein 2